eukprot:Pgem_evm1s16132
MGCLLGLFNYCCHRLQDKAHLFEVDLVNNICKELEAVNVRHSARATYKFFLLIKTPKRIR